MLVAFEEQKLRIKFICISIDKKGNVKYGEVKEVLEYNVFEIKLLN